MFWNRSYFGSFILCSNPFVVCSVVSRHNVQCAVDSLSLPGQSFVYLLLIIFYRSRNLKKGQIFCCCRTFCLLISSLVPFRNKALENLGERIWRRVNKVQTCSSLWTQNSLEKIEYTKSLSYLCDISSTLFCVRFQQSAASWLLMLFTQRWVRHYCF